uniref:Uncharacterized protein n=1 Tax=Tetradesmus obliquus TaxID=3088 RepID=A0A383V649_TETOB|eukprot:jgi/Sobl393_1/3057/SZX61077.1
MDLFFRWATPVVQRGYTKEQLQTEDLLPLPANATPRACTADLWMHWSQTCCKGHPSLLRALIGAFGGPYYALGVLKLLNDALTFAGAMLLNLLVQHLEAATAAATPPPAAAAAAGYLAGNGSSSTYLAGNSTSGLTPGSFTSGDSSLSSSSWLLLLLLPGWVPGPGSAYWGFVLAGLLGLSALAKAVIGSHYSYGLSMVTVR